MGQRNSGDILRHSVLDRLTTSDPRRTGDMRIGIAELVAVVRRDIEWLLNTRKVFSGFSPALREVPNSILAYGMPDFSQFSGANASDRNTITAEVEEALRQFEPRLQPRSIKAVLVESDNPLESEMKLRISGILHVDPIREAISFDTSIQLETGAVRIEVAE